MKGKGLTSEEITAKCRAERKKFKLDHVAPDEKEEIEPIQDLKHLQLSLQEAFFLIWALDYLTILHPETNVSFTLAEIWNTFQNAHIPSSVPQPNAPSLSRFDNPFLVFYIAYHHYRSLGWVIKSGIKFCVDYLLYKRGPVFQHVEFAIVVIPVYEDPEDRANSPTINRVNSQVQKTLVLSYITIAAESQVSPKVLSSPACFAHYSVREVVLRRFIPAHMRD
ncbi:tRNA-intron endonuclease catalytic domain-like protein [Suillus weaverae]|nr:tRNA-intron endonuclease catalytic domain-like protein [Suillus weaverae]